MIVLGLCLGRFLLIFRQNIHWDEFFYLSQVYDFSAGRLADAFQTFHVRLFLPLTRASGDETNQIVFGRLTLFLMTLGSLILMFRAARSKVEFDGALLAIVLWLSLSETMVHANSFRSDPLCLFLVLSGFTLLMRGGLISGIVAGMAVGLAFLVSLKTVLVLLVFSPLFLSSAGMGLVSLRPRALITSLLALLTFYFGITLQNGVIVPRADIGLVMPGLSLSEQLGQRAREFLLPTALPKGLLLVLKSCFENPLSWILLISAPMYSLIVRRGGFSWGNLSWAIFLMVLVLYRNCYSYFLPTLIFPLFVFAAQVLAHSLTRFRQLAPLIGSALLANSLFVFSTWWDNSMEAQQQLIAEVHRRYPSPVPYIDRCGMISSFPKVGPFLSSLVLERYKRAGTPIFSELLQAQSVEFLLLNSPVFTKGEGLGGEDRAILEREFQSSGYPFLLIRRPHSSASEPKTGEGQNSSRKESEAPHRTSFGSTRNEVLGEIFAPY